MTEFNPEKYGFHSYKEGGVDIYGYDTPDFRLEFSVHDGFLSIYDTDGETISEGKVIANNQSLALLLKAFAIKR